MTVKTAIPHLGEVLRALIKAGGYRSYLADRGLDKNLDDLAVEARGRQSSAFELMRGIEDACSRALADDCGYEWAQMFRQAWLSTREALQCLVQRVDTSSMTPAKGRALFAQEFTVPMLASFLQLATKSRSGGAPESWLANPLQHWFAFASSRAGIPEQILLANLANECDADQRTIERWLSGEPIGKVSWPFAARVAAVLDKSVGATELQFLTGWFIFACAFQSLPSVIRDAIRLEFASRKRQSWGLEKAVDSMNRAGYRPDGWPDEDSVLPLLDEIQQLFNVRPLDTTALRDKLKQLQLLISSAPDTFRAAFQPIGDWFEARLAALLIDKEAALKLYASAVSGAWWRMGPNQHQILEEALLYAVGAGDKDAANAYWDKTFMLGLNRSPKRHLDQQEMRRIAFSFERYFAPQKAKERIPLPVEIRLMEDAFSIDRKKHLTNPNQKTRYAEDRVRRTPLMAAIHEGTVDDVKRLIAAGGDPNDFIPESGEGPLTYAMRRACDRKDTEIMDYLLTLDLQPETLNRSASTKRETPLKFAVEMANPGAIARLIELGADTEAACDYLPSALCYAMTLFHGSLHRNDSTQEDAYFAGKSRADVYDAKDGAVLDVDLARRRKRLRDMANASSKNRKMADAVWDYFIRAPENHRMVIQALLVGGADANRRYRVDERDLAVWTPTLFAAQVGDLTVFRMLVEHSGANRGDPDLTLMPPNSLERFDALWVAIGYKRHSIVSYLLAREKHI